VTSYPYSPPRDGAENGCGRLRDDHDEYADPRVSSWNHIRAVGKVHP
jgi:hypothetical protein